MGRSGKLLVLLLLLGLLNVADFWATWDLVVLSGFEEWNPLLRGIVGTPYFALIKLCLIPLGLVFLWLMRDKVMKRFWWLLKFTCGVYLCVVAYTILVFYL